MTAQNDRQQSEQREQDRLAEMDRYRVLASELEVTFDELVRVAAAVAQAPAAALDLTVHAEDEAIINDTRLEPWLAQHPDLAGGPQYRFYAGFPVRTPSGAVLGTLCVFDRQPRSLTGDQVAVLRVLASHMMAQLQLRHEQRQRDQLIVERREVSDRESVLQPGASGLLELAQELAEVGSWTADLRTDVVTWSREAHHILGTDPEMPLDTETIWRYIQPEDHQKVQEAVGAAFTGGRSQDIVFRVSCEDGEARVLRGRFRVDRDAHGTPLRLSGIILDITAARATEQELVRARDLLDQVMAAPGRTGVVAVGPDGLITVFNRGAQIMLGYTPEEMIGQAGYLIFHDLSEIAERTARFVVDPSDDVFEKATETGEDEWTFIRKDGTRLTGQMSVSRMADGDGNPAGHIGFLTDVTEARRAQQELIETKELFGQLLSSATEQAIIGANTKGQVTIFNRGAEIMLGYRAEEILGESADLFHDPAEGERFTGYLQEVAQAASDVSNRPPGTRAVTPDWTYIHQDGHRIKAQIRLSAMRDAQGQVVGFVGISTDVTQQRQSERERDAAKADVQAAMLAISAARDEALAANQAKSAFLATMSHEIRTPMNAVIGMTGLLLDTGLDAEQRDLLETVRGSGDQLLAIINDILDFSKIEAGDLDLEHRSFDLRDLVEGTVAQFAGSAKGLDLISHVDDACPANVIGDATRLRQVLSNLVSNAIKFTSEGDVLVQVTCDELSGNQREVLFSVRDSGIGIPEESMHRLFKSFSQVDTSTTRTYGGTGLGLAISKALVTAMGGEISVTSTVGEGSTFAFGVLVDHEDTVPDARPGRTDASALQAVLNGRRVLIVDGNATHRQILALQLGNQGMQTVSADSSIDALRLLSNPSQDIDLAILDLALPVLDGVQLATAIRRLPQHVSLPLLLMSGLGHRFDDDKHLFAAVLTKPVRSAALIESAAQAVNSASDELALSRPDATSSRPGDPEMAGSAAVPVPSPGPPPNENPSAATSLRILMAEDNEVNQKVGRLILAKLGYQPEIVDNGELALEAAHERTFDVILMDMHMPVMDGLEATRRIRAELPPHRQPRIVALTASVTIEDREACAAAGMDSYLSKPVRPNDLAAALLGTGPVTHG